MTADERIEKLLNRFGQTIEDLPKRYSATSQASARKEAAKFDLQTRRVVSISPESSYICHLADVIDRMEIALETAANNSGCDFCEKQWNDCKLQPNNETFVCDYRIADEWLY